ncbi:NADH dehydrogenase [ubiquinone] 1 alpha subcomplex subunit 10, mitochondrial [Harpegnathos saltator]|uniref:NADH dehydrogenase [ubiquinone] 1 alpha subcomplex subunit 10, mitochondrial n=1 Tax=Harpegnathos saltator TaxID=610380 RepID=E2BQJ3_HARSA|nr:NADH dehydrogenase [ubiquinone] 1 alpha subcomplex subunit 10, mitochondrial [Harpegnathos saltator]EFN82051.1 NADH dehydrogenase [ubiquinone] 1 alpha subcomplex subunit 10, mitochondrial [Harpegnathos saltator]
MASIARIGITKLGYNNLVRQLCKVTTAGNCWYQVAFISRKAKRVAAGIRARLQPFDYMNKQYTMWQQLVDPIIDRLDDNSKIIVIEGPMTSNKAKLGQKLADELDMIYLPSPNFDEYYITNYGYDLRTLDDRLSIGAQSCDLKKFLTNPHHPNVPMFQLHYFQLKYDQYITALLHLLCTGQGVILNRSFYSSFVFAQAMTNAGYMRPQALRFYNKVVGMAEDAVMRPHLVIYLDLPVDVVQERIKKRGIPYEVNSKVLTREYLTDIETSYKQNYLKKVMSHSHVLMYDWTEEGDVMSVIDDIEELNFNIYDKNGKMADWIFETVQELRIKRTYLHERFYLHQDYLTIDLNVPELAYTPDEVKEIHENYITIPGGKYDTGFNTDMGDKGILWKYQLSKIHRSLRTRPRDMEVLKEEFKKLKAAAFGSK